MLDSHQVLGLTPDADEGAVRRRYLELVKQYSPEKSPQQFAEIRAAYEDLREPIRRMERLLFEARSPESIDDILADVRSRLRTARIPTNLLLSLAEM